MTEESPRVTYGVKELLERIENRLGSIDSKLDAKADLREVLDLKKRVDALALQFQARTVLEDDARARSTQAFSKREKVIGLVIACAAVFISPFQQHFHF